MSSPYSKNRQLAPLAVDEMPTQIQRRPPEAVPTFEDWKAQQQKQKDITELPPLDGSQVGTMPFTPAERPLPPSPLQQAQSEYQTEIQSPAHKQSALAQGAWWALQGINKIFNPQDDTPVQWLGEAKRENRIIKAGQKLAPLQAQDKYNRDRDQQQTITDINRIKPELMQEEARRKAEKDVQTAKYNELRLKVGQQKADDWRWAQEQLDAYRKGTLQVSQEKLKQYQQIIDETERWHDIQNENADDRNDTSREKGKPKNNVPLPQSVDKNLMQNIIQHAPAGATQEQINAAYQRALTLKK